MCVCVCVCGRERERETETETETDTDTDRHRHRDRDGETDRDRDRQTDTVLKFQSTLHDAISSGVSATHAARWKSSAGNCRDSHNDVPTRLLQNSFNSKKNTLMATSKSPFKKNKTDNKNNNPPPQVAGDEITSIASKRTT